MKKAYLTLILVTALVQFSKAQNTFPASGNVGIGTGNNSPFPLTVNGATVATNLIQTGSAFDLAPSGTLSTNGFNYNGGAINRSFYSMTKLDVGQYLCVDLEASFPIHMITFGTWFNGDVRNIPAGYNIDYSNDNTNWTNFVTVNNNTNLYPSYSLNISARYWRITVTAYQPGQSQTFISGFKLWSLGTGSVGGDNFWSTPYNGTNIFTQSPVSIGTTYPASGSMLSVAGNLTAESVTVKLEDQWPDYVFSPTYQLPRLSAVKNYINLKRHLPDMPSEKEVVDNGVNLGEMNKLLLKKVEELTLYLIENDQQVKEQSEVNQKQQLELELQKKKTQELEQKLNTLLDAINKK